MGHDGRTVYFYVDLEASGPVPGFYNMVSVGGVQVRWDGEKHVRADSFYYELKPEHLLIADKAAREEGKTLIGIYHSHPDCDAYFSKTDLKNSTPWYSFVVLSIQEPPERTLTFSVACPAVCDTIVFTSS